MKTKLMLIILVGIIISIFIIIANNFKLSNANNFKLSNLSLMKNSCTTRNSLVISNTGVLYGYGSNEYGQLGNGTKPTPVTITLADGVSVTQVSSGYSHTVAIGSDGELYTWGANKYGQLGNGTSDSNSHSTPIKITLSNGVKPVQIACGNQHTIVIGDDGNLYTWGRNNQGQLGDGTTIDKLIPTKISIEKNAHFTQISCGVNYTLAISDGGNLYAWGLNDFGQLGDGTTINRLAPTKISLGDGIKATQISCGSSHGMAIGSDDKLYTWGDNQYGQLGNNEGGYNKYQCIPKSITLEDGVSPLQIACGQGHSLVIGSDSRLYTWGQNNSRQLGNNITEPLDDVDEKKPITIKLSYNVKPVQITCGNWYSMAIGDDGNLYTWGNDGTGRVSFTSIGTKAKPIKTKFNFK